MVWTEITRPKYRREGLRYSSDTTPIDNLCARSGTSQRLLHLNFAFGAFDRLFPPNQMVKELHPASKGKPRPCRTPSNAAISIQSAMEVV